MEALQKHCSGEVLLALKRLFLFVFSLATFMEVVNISTAMLSSKKDHAFETCEKAGIYHLGSRSSYSPYKMAELMESLFLHGSIGAKILVEAWLFCTDLSRSKEFDYCAVVL